ncbi:MAG: PAS domain S-box protein, partial [Gemmataceae bacterium]|nr:PAS domain S-box protein [Gemmataceae bacterium]
MTSLIGAAALVGWAFDIPPLKSGPPGLVPMNPTTAAAFMLSGLSLLLARWPASILSSILTVRLGQLCAFAVTLLAAIRIAGLVSGWETGVDTFLFHEELFSEPSPWPIRMAPNTSLNFLLLGSAVLLLDFETRRGRRPAQFLSLASGAVAFLAVVGYAYGVKSFYGIGSFIPMALNTAVAFLVLSLGVLCARPDRGLMAIFTRGTLGGRVARRLLLPALVIPCLFGWLRWMGESAGFYGTAFGIALYTTAMVVVFSVLVWAFAVSVDRTDTLRRQAEQQVDRFFTLSLDLLCIAGFDGYFKRLNPAWERALGYRNEELLSRPYLDFVHPDDRSGTQSEAARIAAGETALSFENRYRARDGSYRWLLWKAAPVPEAQLIYAAARDITDRKQAEERFRALLE